MKVKDLTKRLALGELRGLYLVDKTDKSRIKDTEQEMLFVYINQGLNHLHSRFLLSEKDIMVVTKTPYTHYYLRQEFAVSSTSNAIYKYLDDNWCDDFKGDVIKILSVHDEQGNTMPLNDLDHVFSLFTPQHDCLQITAIHWNSRFSVLYQARHLELLHTDTERDIMLPFFLEEALQCYVASKVIGHMNGQEHIAHSDHYMMRYEMICQEALSKDLVSVSEIKTNTKLHMRGFT